MNRIASCLIVCAIANVPCIPAAGAATEAVVYSFRGYPIDGATPVAGVIGVDGTLYGTTSSGGTNSLDGGTVFSLNPATGTETVLHSFCTPECEDGANPEAGLTDVKGTLYSTTEGGGSYDDGTVFSVDPATGAETVLYDFYEYGNGDAYYPLAGLIHSGDLLYGTTVGGGYAGNSGTVFSVNPRTGTEVVRYDFCSQEGCYDGERPIAGLIDVNGTLYGTTVNGGTHDNRGTVFSLDPKTRSETVVYSFCAQLYCADGEEPYAGLVSAKGTGTLYGTTYYGGTYGRGTVFSVDPATGLETVLHSFASSGPDGEYPDAGLVEEGGKLYGTTTEGGADGGGTIFSIDLVTGAERVRHSFGSGADGSVPLAALQNVGGTLFGTTADGGAYGYGTVFSFKP